MESKHHHKPFTVITVYFVNKVIIRNHDESLKTVTLLCFIFGEMKFNEVL